MSISLSKLLLGSRYIGIEHFSSGKEEMTASILIRNKKNELVIEDENPIDAAGQLKVKAPVFIVINTNDVVQKEVTSVDASDQKLLHKVFPSLQIDDFYFEIWRLKHKSMVVISRKKIIHDIVDFYKKGGASIVGVSLGVCAISELLPFTDEIQLEISNAVINVQEEEPVITAAKNTGKSYPINGLNINHLQLLAFSGILRMVFKNVASGNVSDYSKTLLETYHQESFFSKGFKLVLGFLLTVLLFNYFAFSYYYKNEQQLSEELLLNKSTVENISRSKERIKIKEERLKNVIAFDGSNISVTINSITKNLPASILLTEMMVNPLVRKIKEDEIIGFEDKSISISGITIDNSSFTTWMEKLQGMPGIKHTTIVNFGKNEANETVFTLKINLR